MSRNDRISVRDRSVLITGAASGIGRATAARFHAAGARVSMLDVAQEALAEAVNGIGAGGDSAPPIALPCDLMDRAAIGEAVDQVIEQRGSIDVLVNNAGRLVGGPFHECDPERIHDVIEVNFSAAVHLTRLVLPHMIERDRGHVISTISSSAPLGTPGYAVYAATKSALITLTRILRRELVGTNIRLTTLCPGSTTTGMTRAMLELGKGAAELPHHPPEVPAAAMLDAVERGLEQVVVSSRPRTQALVAFLDRLFPHMMDRYWQRQVQQGDWLEGASRGGL
jgi:NAD(P)-dependent dehydrogenase (short-subunit alcohol dehydrogenase family)